MVLRSKGLGRWGRRRGGLVWDFATNHSKSDGTWGYWQSRPGEEKGGQRYSGKDRREKEEGKGTDLFVAMARGTNFGLWVTPSGQPRALQNPSGVAILHLAAVSPSRLIIMLWCLRD